MKKFVLSLIFVILSIGSAFSNDAINMEDLTERPVRCSDVNRFFSDLNEQLSYENQLEVTCVESSRRSYRIFSDVIFTKTLLTFKNNENKIFCKKIHSELQRYPIELKETVDAIKLDGWANNSSTFGEDILKDHHFRTSATRKYLLGIQFPLCE